MHQNSVSHDVEHFFKSHCFIKSITASVVAASLDNYINYAPDIRANPIVLGRNISFGAVVGGALIGANYIAPSFTHLVPIPDTALFSGKTLEHRLIEVSLGAGGAVVLNRVMSGSGTSLISQIGIIVLSDFIGEYVADYSKSKPLSYLT